MEEIMKFENSKIEVNNGIEKDKMMYEDQLRKIEDSITDCKMKMEQEKQRQSTMRNQLGDYSRMINE